MGALCVLTGATDALKVGCKPSDAPAGGLAFTDGVRKTAANFGATFPYLTTPLPGNFRRARSAAQRPVEERDRALPGLAGRGGVVARRRVVVEAVLRARIA